MAISTYASLRQQSPGITFTVNTGSGNLTSGSLWFCVQGRNRVGRNLLSSATQLTWSNGDAIDVTIGSSAVVTGEEIFEFIISAFGTNTPTSMKKLFAWRTRNTLTLDGVNYPGQGTAKTLPNTITLTEDSQLELSATVADTASLPTADLLFGQIVYVTADSEYLMYDDLAEAGTVAASVGYWVTSSASELNAYQSATTAVNGCDRPLINLTSSDILYPPPAYAADGSDSQPIRFWYSNGLTESGGAVELQGTILNLQFARNGQNVTDVFSGRAIAELVGYVRRSTGVLDTSIPTTGNELIWTATDSPIELPQDVAQGYAAVYDIYFRFRASELEEQIPDGAQISMLLYPEGLLGKPDTSWAIVGDVVLESGDLMRILPTSAGVKRLSGKCLVGGYRSPFVGETELTGLPEDEPTVRVCVSAALAGKLTYRLPSDDPLSTEAVRAVASTSAGTHTASGYSVSTTIAGNTESLQVQVNYPELIRSDYPDRIAGTATDFVVPEVLVYVLFGGDIYELPNPVTPTAPSQTIVIDDLSGATVIGSLPTTPSADFCLFGYGTITSSAITAGSNLAAGNYQVAIAYNYPSPNTLPTAISHSESDGAIPEFIPLQDAIAQASEIFVDESAPTSGIGSENDVFFFVDDANSELKIYKKTDPSTWTLSGTLTIASGSTVTVDPSPPSSAPTAIGEVYAESGITGKALRVATNTTDPTDFEVFGFTPLLVNADPNGVEASRCAGDQAFDTSSGTLYISDTAESTTWTAVSGGGGDVLLEADDTPTTGSTQVGLWYDSTETANYFKVEQPANAATDIVALTTQPQYFTAPHYQTQQTLTPSGSVATPDINTGAMFVCAVNASITLDPPINASNGAYFEILFVQDGGGSITFDAAYLFTSTVPTLSATVGEGLLLKCRKLSDVFLCESVGDYVVTVADTPIATYSFEDTSWLDSVGTRHLTAQGSGMGINASGFSGNCANFPASSGYLDRTDADMSFNSGDWRIEFYFRLPSLGAYALISVGDDLGSVLGEFYCRVFNDSGSYKVQLLVYDDSFGTAATVLSTVVLSATNFYSCKIGVRSGGTEAFVDVDGTETTATISTALGVAGSGAHFYIGADDIGTVVRAAADLRIDEMSIYA